MNKKRLLLFILLATLFSSIVLANENKNQKQDIKSINEKRLKEIETKEKLNFNDVLFYTYENNNELKAEREKLKAVETTKFRTFGENVLPEVALNVKRGRQSVEQKANNQKYDINHDLDVDEITFSQPVFKSGRTVNSLRIVDNEIGIQRNTLISREQSLLFQAISSALNVLRTKVRFNITKQNEESLKKGYEYSSARQKAGKATITDVFTAKSRYKTALSNTAIAKTNMTSAKANFRRIVSLDPDKIYIEQLDSLFKEIELYRISQDEVIEKASADNPDYLIIKENYSLNKNTLNFSKTDFLPSVTLDAQAYKSKTYTTTSRAMTRNEVGNISLNLKVPIVQSGVKYADYKSSGYSLNQSKFELRNSKRVLREQSIQTYEEFLLTKELLVTALASMQATKKALDSSREESKVGKVTIIEVLDRRKEYFDAQIDLIEVKTQNIIKFYALKVLMGDMVLTKLDIGKK